jgi:hypothetical protein
MGDRPIINAVFRGGVPRIESVRAPARIIAPATGATFPDDVMPYRSSALLTLLGLIARRGDRGALDELLTHRRPFSCRDGNWLRLGEWVDWLMSHPPRSASLMRNDRWLEQARDLTIDKFTCLPKIRRRLRNRPSCRVKGVGINCRYYYLAVWRYSRRQLATFRPIGHLEQEQIVSRILHAFVLRHFSLSFLECQRRSNPLVRRYYWKIDGRTIVVWMPTEMSGRECREWLQANVSSKGSLPERECFRVQSIIDEHLLRRGIVPLDEHAVANLAAQTEDSGDSTLDESFDRSLSEYVAREKSGVRLEQQRPAIKALGATRLATLIRRIFAALAQGAYDDGALADEFGLSHATFSRFAGSRWCERFEGQSNGIVPDLWRNTSQVLAGVPAFVAAARDAGVWGRVQAVIRSSNTGTGK